MLTWHLGQRLTVRLTAVALASLAAVTVATGWYAARSAQHVLQRQTDAHGASLAKASSITCIEPLLLADYPVLDTYAETLVKGKHEVSFLRIDRADGTVVAESPRGGSRDPELLRQCRVYECDVTISADDATVLGKVRVGISTKQSDAEIAGVLRALTLGITLSFVFFAVLFVWTIRRLIGRPLKQLDAAATAAGEGDLDTPIRLERNDELGHLAETLDQMRHNLKSSRNELLRQNEQLKEVDRLKSEFLANMSHEIRTPMTAILGFADLLRTEDGIYGQSPQSAEAVESIVRNGQYLLDLINDILDLSKVEAGQMEVECIACSPRKIAEDVVALTGQHAEDKGLSLEVAYDGPIPKTIDTDPVRLRQILINLVGNAVKFTESGEVRLRLRLLKDDHARHELQFQVVDTGVGIAEDQIPRLFEPFTQADSSTTRCFGGTGLGLTISKRLCELLGGSLDVSSRPGRGSAFTVHIPTGPLTDLQSVDEPKQAESPRIEPAEAPSEDTSTLDGRILLAEDGPDNQRLFQRILRKAGANVAVAENGAIALEMVEAAQHNGCPFDMILMDMQMPVMDGYDATRALRNAGYANPIIALTAHAMASDREKCLSAGCDDYLSKPIDRDTLLGVVRRYGSKTVSRVSN